MQTLISILAGVALLVWGTHIVRSGVLRIFGGNLRKVLSDSISSRFHAFLPASASPRWCSLPAPRR